MAEEDNKPENEEAEAPAEEAGELGEGEEGEEGGEGAKKPKKKKKLLILIVALVVVAAAGGGAFLMGVFDKGGEMSEEELALLEEKTIYLDLDEFLVNLNNPGRQVTFLKMKITLELPNAKTQAVINNKMPRIRDAFQVYLRELRSSDLRGSAGTARLREELMLRINKIIEPEKVTDVLFKDIIVQ